MKSDLPNINGGGQFFILGLLKNAAISKCVVQKSRRHLVNAVCGFDFFVLVIGEIQVEIGLRNRALEIAETAADAVVVARILMSICSSGVGGS